MGKDSLLNNYTSSHPFVTGDTEGLNRILGDESCIYNSSIYDEYEDDEDVSRTYDEWLSVGRQVQAGEKSHKAKGKYFFYLSQTKPIKIGNAQDDDWNDDDELTYDEWQERGYQVMRGEKSHRRGGKALFYFSQVKQA